MEQKDRIRTLEVPKKEVNEILGKEYFINEEHRELTEDENYYKTLVETLKKKYVRKLYTEEEVEILNRPVGSVNKKLTDLSIA